MARVSCSTELRRYKKELRAANDLLRECARFARSTIKHLNRQKRASLEQALYFLKKSKR